MPFKKGNPIRNQNKPGKTSMQNPALKAIRAQAIIEARVQGTTVPDLAKRFNCSEMTIYRTMQWAKKEGLLGELKQRVVEKLGSLSLDVYESAMKASPSSLTPVEIEAHKMKLGAAKDVAFGAGILTKKSEQSITKSEEHTLNWYLEQRNGKSSGEESEVEEVESASDSTLDAEILEEGGFAGDDFLGLPESTDGGGSDSAGSGGMGESEE